MHPSMAIASAVHDLKTLVMSFHPVVAIETSEEERAERVVAAVAEDLGLPVYEWTITRGLIRSPSVTPEAHRATAEARAMLAHLGTLQVDALFLLKDLVPHLEQPENARLFRDAARRYTRSCSTLILVGSSLSFPPAIEPDVIHVQLALPGAEELGTAIDTVLMSLRGRLPIELSPPEREELLRALQGLTLNQARQLVARTLLSESADRALDIPSLLKGKADLLGDDDLLEYFPAADNRYELGGFGRLARWLERARVGFSPRAAELNLSPPRGVLLAGVQGCGKSLAAKWVARQWKMPLLKFDAGRLYNKYIGESERNMRRAIAIAESMAPSVLWIDEIEKAFSSSRAGDDPDGGTSKRILATFLTWMQEKKEPVFVVATANDVFSLPPEMLRKGRFDELFFVDLPNLEERIAIARIQLSQRKQRCEHFDLEELAAATDGFSGAELEQVVVGALYGALHSEQPLDTELLLQEAQQTVPLSVSRREDIERLRAIAQDRFVPVR